MIVTMETGVTADDERVKAVVEKARSYGLNPDVGSEKGRKYSVTQVFLRDGPKVASASVPDHVFRAIPGVNAVQRVTPPRVSVAHGKNGDPHLIDIGGAMIGTGLPCRIIAGPCTVDRHIDEIVGMLVNRCGIKRIRGGCWKPRSSPVSFPGFGETGLEWLLRAAEKHGATAVFTEVIEASHIDIVRRLQKKTRYHGRIVLWVGARTHNSLLLKALGAQRDYPVMLKNTVDALGVDDLYSRAEWVLSGNLSWRCDGTLDAKASLRSANHDVVLCLRGTRQSDPRSPWRFIPNHHWAELIQEQSWAPVAIDPSHSAGTTDKGLVMRNIKDSLAYKPSLIMVEGGYPRAGFGGHRGFCDVAQMLPIEDLGEVVSLVEEHNRREYRCLREH